MQKRSFVGVVHAGHKERAVEVPFDPSPFCGHRPERFAPGRTGVAVHCRVNGVDFESHVVSRSGKRWLLIPPEVEHAAGVRVGSEANVLFRLPPDVA